MDILKILEENRDSVLSITRRFDEWCIEGWSKKLPELTEDEGLHWNDVDPTGCKVSVVNESLDEAVREFVLKINA